MQLLWQPIEAPTAEAAALALAPLFVLHGAPLVLKCDNGSPFGAPAVGDLLAKHTVAVLKAWLREPPRGDGQVLFPNARGTRLSADGVHYWDVHGQRYLDALSGIYVASVGHNNRRVIEAVRQQYDVLHFSPPMHGTNPVAVRLAAGRPHAPGERRPQEDRGRYVDLRLAWEAGRRFETDEPPPEEEGDVRQLVHPVDLYAVD